MGGVNKRKCPLKQQLFLMFCKWRSVGGLGHCLALLIFQMETQALHTATGTGGPFKVGVGGYEKGTVGEREGVGEW